MISKEKLYGIFNDYEEILTKRLLRYELEEETIFDKVREFNSKIVVIKLRSKAFSELGKENEIQEQIFLLDTEIYNFFIKYGFQKSLFTSSLNNEICNLCISFIDIATDCNVDIKSIKIWPILQYYSDVKYEKYLNDNEDIKLQKLLLSGIANLSIKDKFYVNECIYYLLLKEFLIEPKVEKRINRKKHDFNLAYLESFRANLEEIKKFVM